MTKNTQPTWKEIARTILSKSKDEYASKLKPAANTGRNKLGTLIEALGRKIQN